MQVPLSSPDITEQDRAAVMEVLNSRFLSLGPKLPAFEQAVAHAVNSRHAIAVNSGTSGLHLCVRAANLSDEDEVITTPFSFVASANCMLFERAKPVFVDIDPITYNIDPDRIESAITPRTRAILPVHVFGRPCGMSHILRLARKHNLTVIEDSCEALGAQLHGKFAGTFGQTGVFAFYPNKQLTTGEGGIIVTDDDGIARRCRSWRNQGRSENEEWLEHDELGYNYRLSDLNCALGLTQISRLEQVVHDRHNAAELYNAALSAIPQIVPPRIHQPDCRISWFVYVVRLQDEFNRTHRNQVIAALRSRGIGCRDYFPTIHLQPLYRRMFGYAPGDFPVAEHISDRTIALPFFNRLTENQIQYVCEELKTAVDSLIVQKTFSLSGSSLQPVAM